MIKRSKKICIAQIEGEDLIMFINACFTCTKQSEFYDNALSQTISIEFLHQYILGNYRRLYALTLASGINHFNKSLIINNLLSVGSPGDPSARKEEAELIKKALQNIPVNRVFKLFAGLKKKRVNNRRTRAVIKDYIQSRKNRAFDAVKYRSKLKKVIAHVHMKINKETGRFLFEDSNQPFETPIFESYQRAKYNQHAIYELPYTIAEGFAQKKGIPRATFLKKIKSKLTKQERLRLQSSAAREKNMSIEVDFNRTELTKLALYWLSLEKSEQETLQESFELALDKHAKELGEETNIKRNKIALVADRSFSMWGSIVKKRRPLAIVFAIHQILRRTAKEYEVFWSTPVKNSLHLTAAGQTNIADPFIEALKTRPDIILIISDGFENDPPGLTSRVYQAWLEMQGKSVVSVLHLNPVYDAENYNVKKLGNGITSLGIRNAEDLTMILEYSQFASGLVTLEKLEKYLRYKFLGNTTVENLISP